MLRLPGYASIPGGRAFASLSRRVRMLIIAAVLFVALFALALTLPVPYVILSPGPTCNTLTRCEVAGLSNATIIRIDGLPVRRTSGHLNLTTVSESNIGSVNVFQAIAGWLHSDEIVVPDTVVKQPGQSQQQVNQQNTQDFLQSEDSATQAALCELGYPKGFGVVSVLPKSPAAGVLHPGDQLVSIDAVPVDSAGRLTSVMQAQTPGKRVAVVVKRQTSSTSRQAVPETLYVTLGKPSDKRKGAFLGITFGNTCLAPFQVDVNVTGIGGPSAGLMLALGIIDKVGLLGDLTAGRFIAGTGTIDPTGKVGPIGGIPLKMLAARRHGATVFLAPAGNCSDVRKTTPAGLQVIRVSTLHGAVQDLRNLQQHKPVPGC